LALDSRSAEWKSALDSTSPGIVHVLELLQLVFLKLESGTLSFLYHPNQRSMAQLEVLVGATLEASADICMAAREPYLLQVTYSDVVARILA
jgi:hypothetical protein